MPHPSASWVDTHCHLDASEFDADRLQVRQAARAAGVGHCVLVAVERSHWQAVRDLAHATGDSYALGIHPLYTPQAQEGDIDALRVLLTQWRDDPQLVAVGEIGLDFFVPALKTEAARARQQWFYAQQVALARTLQLPAIVHVRHSSDALLKTLRATPVVGGIAHAFNGSWQQAQINLDVVAPASGLSMAWFYGVGVVFGVSAGLILLHELFLAITGRLNPDELVTLKDGEAADEIEHLHHQQAAAGRNA